MEIVALVENTTKKGWQTEHGLSLFIRTENHCILFDTGQGSLFAENAERAGIDLTQADICVLSHGHYDHGGGIKLFAAINQRARIYMSRQAFGLHYHAEERYIGLPREWLTDAHLQQRIVFTDGDLKIDGQLTLYVPRKEKRIEMGSAGLCVKKDGHFMPEDFRHEQYLMLEENGRRILISGCSHQGIVNIMEWFRPDILIGGFHFMKQGLNKELAGYGAMLAAYDTDYYTCHCTGVEQFAFLQPQNKRLHYLSEGERLIL